MRWPLLSEASKGTTRSAIRVWNKVHIDRVLLMTTAHRTIEDYSRCGIVEVHTDCGSTYQVLHRLDGKALLHIHTDCKARLCLHTYSTDCKRDLPYDLTMSPPNIRRSGSSAHEHHRLLKTLSARTQRVDRGPSYPLGFCCTKCNCSKRRCLKKPNVSIAIVAAFVVQTVRSSPTCRPS